jgi:hypothetical protein
MLAVIELDGELDNPESKIIGGEYLDTLLAFEPEDDGFDRLRNAPFAWIATAMNNDNAHNPFVQGKLVQQLLDLGKASRDGTP